MLLTRLIPRLVNERLLLKPVVCVSEVNRYLSAEKRNIKWKKKAPRIITPRNPLSLPSKSVVKKNKFKDRTIDSWEVPPFVEVDPYNSKLVRLLTAVKTKQQRYQNMLIMLEGKRLIKEALAADVEPILILFSRKKLLRDLPFDLKHIQPESTIIHYLPNKHMRTWSSLTTCPGLIGVFRLPNLENNEPVVETLPVTLVCDNIRDPGNLGSILRVAAALPVERVILLSGCADLWDSKVTRGSSGSMFHLKIMNNASWDDVEDHCLGNVILADHAIEKGIDEEEDENTVIEAEDYYEDPETQFNNPAPDENDKDDDNEDDEDSDDDFRDLYDLPSRPYYDLAYKRNNSYTVIVGGEAEGLSEQSFQFAEKMKGLRVNIPLAMTVNCLNSATALGVISFEIKRQMLSQL